MQILFHYTDKHSYKLIKKSGKIKKSEDINTDAILGEGVYLTSLTPEEGKVDIARNNYDGGSGFQLALSQLEKGKVDYYFVFLMPDEEVISGTKRDVWLYPDEDLILDEFVTFYGKFENYDRRVLPKLGLSEEFMDVFTDICGEERKKRKRRKIKEAKEILKVLAKLGVELCWEEIEDLID